MNVNEYIKLQEIEASKPLPTDTVTRWLSEVLQQIEQDGAWDDGAVLRAAIIAEYGLKGLQYIERYQRQPVVDTYEGGAVAWWNSRDPWSTAKEYKRRKDDIRKLYRGV